MKSPFGWCVIAVGLLTSGTAVAVAQSEVADDGGYQLSEPFAGSAAVLLNREPSPVETYNDLDGEVCNFVIL